MTELESNRNLLDVELFMIAAYITATDLQPHSPTYTEQGTCPTKSYTVFSSILFL